MAASYKNGAYVLQKAEPRRRAFEMPTVTETWRGQLGNGGGTLANPDSSTRDAFVAAVTVGSSYNGGYLVDVSSREQGLFAEVDRIVGYAPLCVNVLNRLSYLLDGGYAKKTASLSANVQNSSILPGQDNLSCNRKVSFYSPSSKYTYFMTSLPTGPVFAGVSGTTQPVIVGSIMTAAAGGQTATFAGATAPAPIVSALFMPVTDILDEFDPIQIPGTPWYKVTETWARVYQGDKA